MNDTTLTNDIQKLVLEIKESLISCGEMMATAESCTGGLIASEIVNVPGSSEILAGGIVAYQNEVKESLLGVPHEILERHGAVSQETANAMANGALKQFHCQWAVSTTGIAGPGGAEPGKPVGTVWMSVNNSVQNETFCEIFTGNRLEIRQKAVYTVLSRLLFLLNKQKSTCTNEH